MPSRCLNDSSVSRRLALKSLAVGLFASSSCRAMTRHAQQATTYSDNTILSIGKMQRSMKDFDGFLKAIGLQFPATGGTNYFAVSVGGIDAVRDLEEGRGVDPETLAGLYAGRALPKIAQHLNMNRSIGQDGKLSLTIEASDGRLRYKGSVVRLYSARKLSNLFSQAVNFRSENRKTRSDAVSAYLAFARNRQGGKFRNESSTSEITEMVESYRQLNPVIVEAESALRGDVNFSSVLPEGTPHYFGLASGGIDVQSNLEAGIIDLETLAAVYAGATASDFASEFEITKSGVLFRNQLLQVYSQTQLRAAFAERRRLLQIAKTR